jgi:hypothetical protein
VWLVAFLSLTAPKGVYGQLKDAGHDPFVPTYMETVSFRGRAVQQERELFPRYVFIRYSHRWPEANAIKGVRVLAYTDSKGFWRPHVLPDDFLAGIVKPEARESEDDPFHYGDWVQITISAAAGCFGQVKRRKNGAYEIEVDFMGGRRIFSIAQHGLKLARSGNADERRERVHRRDTA